MDPQNTSESLRWKSAVEQQARNAKDTILGHLYSIHLSPVTQMSTDAHSNQHNNPQSVSYRGERITLRTAELTFGKYNEDIQCSIVDKIRKCQGKRRRDLT